MAKIIKITKVTNRNFTGTISFYMPSGGWDWDLKHVTLTGRFKFKCNSSVDNGDDTVTVTYSNGRAFYDFTIPVESEIHKKLFNPTTPLQTIPSGVYC